MSRSIARVLTLAAALGLLVTIGGLAGCETPKADPALPVTPPPKVDDGGGQNVDGDPKTDQPAGGT